MKKLVFSVLIALATASCGTPKESIHDKLLSFYPQYIVRKAFETHNNLVFYSFDLNALRDRLPETPKSPSDASNKMGLVSAWDFPAKAEFECQDPMKLDGLAACLFDGTQVAMPPLDFDTYMRKNGAIAEEVNSGAIYRIKPASKEQPSHPISASKDEEGFMATKSFREDTQRLVTLKVANQDKPITNFDSVRMCLEELYDYPAIQIVFCAESFTSRANSNAILSPAYSAAQIGGLMKNFDSWGRSAYIQNAAFGSKWINGAENIKGIFVYVDEDKAKEDFERFARASVSIPSFYTGKLWYERMNMTVPLFTHEGRKVTVEFDMKERAKSFQFPLLMRFADKFEDWGWLWLK